MTSGTPIWSAAWIVLAAAASVRLIRVSSAAPPFVHNGYRWLAGSALCLGLGAVAQFRVSGLVGGTPPLRIADLISLAGLPALVIGLATITADGGEGGREAAETSRWRPYQFTPGGVRQGTAIAVDCALLVVSLFAICLVVLFGPDYTQAGASPGPFALDLIRPVAGLVTLGLIGPFIVRNLRLTALPALALAALTAGEALAVAARAGGVTPGIGPRLALVAGLALLAATPGPATTLQTGLPGGGERAGGLSEQVTPVPAQRAGTWLASARIVPPAAAVAAAVVIAGYAVFGHVSLVPAVAITAVVIVILLVVEIAWFASRALTVSASAQASDGVFHALADTTSDTVLICDLSGTIEYISHSGKFGYPRGALPGTRLADIVHPEDRAAGTRAMMAALRGSSRTATFRGRVRSADGSWRQVSAALSCCGQRGEPARLLITCHDDSEIVALRRQLTQVTFHDGVTGLPNRAYLEDRAKGMHAGPQAGTGPGATAAAIMVGLDDGAMHEISGHQSENLVLAQAGRRLRSAAPPGAIVGRWSAAQFAVLIDDISAPGTGLTDASQVTELGYQLARSISAEPFALAASAAAITASVGVAVSQADQCDQVLSHAHVAMSKAAAAGGARVEVFSSDMDASGRRRAELGAALGNALAEHQLRIEYQPVVDLRSAQVTCVEALPGWCYDGEPVDVARLLGVAEDLGLAGQLWEWLLRSACAQVSAWRTAGAELGLAISCPPRQIALPGFAAWVLEAVADAGLPPQALTLRLAERALADAAGPVAAELARLRASGVRLAIDNFGTGYASLSYLRQLAVDEIKVDGSFTAGLGSDPTLTLMMPAIIGLGRDLGIEMIAAGVERGEQAERLKAMGCDLGQGSWLAARLPASAVDPAAAAAAASWMKDAAGDPACSAAS
ncbi:MAG TPA: sensor domain-containing phosphodiesterase [Streptosporangiaceae bacterium]|nr:sensor domain-containing phosphodiesterase [Streptosporangiaceae bacterium]